MSDDARLSDEQLAELIAATKLRLSVLYAMKKARQMAAKGVVPRAVSAARTRERDVEIRRLRREQKLSYREIATRFGLSSSYIPGLIAALDYDERMALLYEKWRPEREARARQ